MREPVMFRSVLLSRVLSGLIATGMAAGALSLQGCSDSESENKAPARPGRAGQDWGVRPARDADPARLGPARSARPG